MATIRASCPDCGDVELTTNDMIVRVCVTDNKAAYVFRCPSCEKATSKTAEPRIVDLLVSSGVELQVWTPPAELQETRLFREAFNTDDMLKFHELLQTEDWFGPLQKMVTG